MLDPESLFEINPEAAALERPVLVQAMDGFVDAGNAAKLARAHLLGTLESERVVTFDIDQLFDYRGRRPEMLFATDHWESYATPELSIDAVRDAQGKSFLLLSGPEPDAQWERFCAAVQLVVQRLDVSLLVGLNAIPMGVPHTRPATVIAHGSPQSLVVDYTNWLGTVQVPASAGHLLEFRLGNAGLDAMGFAVNVPHYLAHLDFPLAAAKLIDVVAKAGDLTLPTTELVEAGAVTRVDLDAQVAASEQIASVVTALEKQYDEIVAGRLQGLVPDGSPLPTADELGAEFEKYLSQQPETGEDPPAL